MPDRRIAPHDFFRRAKDRRNIFFEQRRHVGVARILWITLGDLFTPGRRVTLF